MPSHTVEELRGLSSTPAEDRTWIQAQWAVAYTFGTESSPYVRPIMQYRGSKYGLLDWILPHLPDMPRYVEPFGGTGAVLLNRKPVDFEVYNDLEPHWKLLVEAIQHNLTELWEYLDWYPYSREEYEKAQRKGPQSPLGKPAAWYLRHMISYGSRGNWFQQGEGAEKMLLAYREWYKHWSLLRSRLRGVLVTSVSYADLFEAYDTPETLWYLDPPYLGTQGFYQCDFSLSDHQIFLDKVRKLQGYVVLSHFEDPVYDAVLWDEKYCRERSRQLSSTGGDPHVEALYIKHAGHTL